MKQKLPIFSLLLITLLTGCNGTKTPIHIDFPTIEPDPTASPTTEIVEITPTETLTPAPSPTPTHWSDEQDCEIEMIEPGLSQQGRLIFGNEKLGVEFEYPPPDGDYQYEFANLVCYSTGEDGWLTVSSIFWTFDAISTSNEERNRTYFASAISSEYAVDSNERPTEAIRFRRTTGEYFLDLNDGREFQVEPLKIILHPDGVYALVYNPVTTMGLAWPNEKAVVILLPEGYRPDFEAINIHLDKELDIDLIEELIYSIRFLDLPDEDFPE
jgi:hypothetical protein